MCHSFQARKLPLSHLATVVILCLFRAYKENLTPRVMRIEANGTESWTLNCSTLYYHCDTVIRTYREIFTSYLRSGSNLTGLSNGLVTLLRVILYWRRLWYYVYFELTRRFSSDELSESKLTGRTHGLVPIPHLLPLWYCTYDGIVMLCSHQTYKERILANWLIQDIWLNSWHLITTMTLLHIYYLPYNSNFTGRTCTVPIGRFTMMKWEGFEPTTSCLEVTTIMPLSHCFVYIRHIFVWYLILSNLWVNFKVQVEQIDNGMSRDRTSNLLHRRTTTKPLRHCFLRVVFNI